MQSLNWEKLVALLFLVSCSQYYVKYASDGLWTGLKHEAMQEWSQKDRRWSPQAVSLEQTYSPSESKPAQSGVFL